jgi:hypothetical protein
MTDPRRLVVALAVTALASAAVRGQDPSPLKLLGLYPAGLRATVSDRWSELTFTVANPGPTPRDARVVVGYAGAAETGYGRDISVPANTAVTSWVTIGPAPAAGASISREIQMVLYDRTGGTPVVVRPATEERTRGRAVLYRPKETTTALFVDDPAEEDLTSFRRPTPDQEALTLLRVLRAVRNQSEHVSVVREPRLPTTPEAYDGIDQIVLANDRLKADPLTRAAVRRWVEQGGYLWVMLDQVDPDFLAALFGEEFAPHVVGRTSLTGVRVQSRLGKDPRPNPGDKAGLREYERPVPFVRVAASGHESVLLYADGWPAAFTQRLGRGKVLFTALGPTGWHRPRAAAANPRARGGDPPSPFKDIPDLPVALDHLLELSADMKPVEHPFAPADLQPPLMDEIGYAVPGRGAVAATLGGFVLALFGLSFVVRRSRRTELVGWLGPAAAVAAGGLLVGLGSASRNAVPPTGATAEIVEAIPATDEVVRRGLFATYHPASGPVTLAAPAGGRLAFDFAGLEGQPRTRVQTDLDSWRYENLQLPAGVRQGPFRATTATPMSAVAAFGPDGLRGTFTAPMFRDPTDAVLAARGRDPVAVRFAADGAFAVGPADALSPGQFVAGAVLSDRQQRRQDVFRKLLTPAPPDHFGDRDHLLAWTTAAHVPFATTEGARTVGASLAVVPVEYRPPPAGTRVLVPRAFVPYRRVLDGNAIGMTTESAYPIDLRVRFQVPPSVVPLEVEKATVTVKMKAGSRKVTLGGYAGERPTPLRVVDGPTEPVVLEVTDPQLLKLDAAGGWHFQLAVGGAAAGGGRLDEVWTIESLGVEFVGTTAARR